MRELNANEVNFIAGGQDLYLAFTKEQPPKKPNSQKPDSKKPESSISSKELIYLCEDLDSQTTSELIERQRYLEDEIREREIANTAAAGVVATAGATALLVPPAAPAASGAAAVTGLFMFANELAMNNYSGELLEVTRELEGRRGGRGD